MKIRNGFVSNSSSSSFVFAYDEERSGLPENLNEPDIELARYGGERYKYYPLDDDMRAYLESNPKVKSEISYHIKGFVKLSSDFQVSENLVGKNIEVKSFGIYDMPDRVADDIEDFFEDED